MFRPNPRPRPERIGSPNRPSSRRAAPWRVCRAATLALLVIGAPFAGGGASADQRSAALPALFDALRAAGNGTEAARLEGQIWQEWLRAPDAASRELLGELDQAMRARDMERALARADELVDAAPTFAEAWNKRATVHYLLGDDDSSVADIRETLALEPRHFGAISGLGLIFLRQGDERAALTAFEQVLAISPASESARRSAERVRRELDSEI